MSINTWYLLSKHYSCYRSLHQSCISFVIVMNLIASHLSHGEDALDGVAYGRRVGSLQVGLRFQIIQVLQAVAGTFPTAVR